MKEAFLASEQTFIRWWDAADVDAHFAPHDVAHGFHIFAYRYLLGDTRVLPIDLQGVGARGGGGAQSRGSHPCGAGAVHHNSWRAAGGHSAKPDATHMLALDRRIDSHDDRTGW